MKSNIKKNKTKNSNSKMFFHPMLIVGGRSPKISYLKSIVITTIMFIISTIVFVFVFKIDVVAIASGVIVTSNKSKIVQPGIDGLIKKIYVRDGYIVKDGELLAELDNTTAISRQKQLSKENSELKKKKNQLLLLIESVNMHQTKSNTLNIINSGKSNEENSTTESMEEANEKKLQFDLLDNLYKEYKSASPYYNQKEFVFFCFSEIE